MAISGKSHVSGLSEARELLRRLPEKVADKVLAESVREGTKIVHRAVMSSTPVSKGKRSKASQLYGHLKENVRMFRLKFDIPQQTAIFRVSTGDGFWGRFLEFGTRFVAARPWFRPAVDRSADQAVNAIKERLAVGIEREAMSLSKGRR